MSKNFDNPVEITGLMVALSGKNTWGERFDDVFDGENIHFCQNVRGNYPYIFNGEVVGKGQKYHFKWFVVKVDTAVDSTLYFISNEFDFFASSREELIKVMQKV